MYTIIDEPRPGKWAHLVVSPLFPLLGLMLGGAWLGLPWFVFNAMAMGCPEQGKTTWLALIGFMGALGIGFLIGVLGRIEIVNAGNIQYALLTTIVWKLWIGYELYILQGRTFHLFEYFGGPVKNGFLLILIALLFGRQFILDLVAHPLWKIMMS